MNVSMKIPCTGRTIIDIRQTALKHITTYLPAVHALTAFDTVSYLFGIGKAATTLKILMGGHHLIELGQQRADEDKLISEATYELSSLLPITDPKWKAI